MKTNEQGEALPEDTDPTKPEIQDSGSLDSGTLRAREAPVFRRPDGRELPAGHHLSKNRHGKFVLRLTVYRDGDSRFIGQRVAMQLRTTDSATAIGRRDAIIEFLKLMGFLCRDVVLAEE